MSNTAAMPIDRPTLLVEGLIKKFRGVAVLRGVEFAVSAGETVVLYGSNGSGKTTMLRILATLSRAHAGRFELDGVSGEERDEIRGHLYYSGHGTQVYDDFAPEENLRFFTGLYGMKPSAEDIQHVLEDVGLWRFRHMKAFAFSAGMKRRLGLARMMLLRPKLLLLDEPYTSLDTAGIALVNRFLRNFAESGGATLMSSHSPELVKTLPHRPIWLHAGKIQAEAPSYVA